MAQQNMAHRRTLKWGCPLLVVGIAAVVIAGGIWLIVSRPQANPAGPRPTAILWTATPTTTPTPNPTPTPPPVPSGELGRGVRVQVTGTGAAGLSMRAEAGTAAERIDVAQEGEILLIAAGPQDADGYTWWLVRDENNPEREGWAAAAYLSPIDN